MGGGIEGLRDAVVGLINSIYCIGGQKGGQMGGVDIQLIFDIWRLVKSTSYNCCHHPTPQPSLHCPVA